MGFLRKNFGGDPELVALEVETDEALQLADLSGKRGELVTLEAELGEALQLADLSGKRGELVTPEFEHGETLQLADLSGKRGELVTSSLRAEVVSGDRINQRINDSPIVQPARPVSTHDDSPRRMP